MRPARAFACVVKAMIYLFINFPIIYLRYIHFNIHIWYLILYWLDVKALSIINVDVDLDVLTSKSASTFIKRVKTNLKTGQEQFIKSNAPTARPLISVRSAETQPRDYKRTQTSYQKKSPQQQHRRTPLKSKPHYRLGLCYVFNLEYRPLSTNYTRKLVY